MFKFSKTHRVAISTFNMYKGGSKTILDIIAGHISADLNVLEICHGEIFCKKAINKIAVKYPVKKLNWLYRIIIENIYMAIVGFIWRAEKLVMLGNFPCFFWFGEQRVFFHNTLYIDDSLKQESLKFKLEKKLFVSLIKIKNPTMLVQTKYVEKLLRSKFGTSIKICIIGTPSSFSRHNLVKKFRKNERAVLFYPAINYPHKNHKLIVKNYDLYRHLGCVVRLTIDRPLDEVCYSSGGEIEYIGFQCYQSIANLYLNTDAIIFPSLKESLGLPLLEAVELGIPVIAPSLPYVKAAIFDYYSFEIDDDDSFRDAVQRCVIDIKSGSVKIPKSNIIRSPQAFTDSLII